MAPMKFFMITLLWANPNLYKGNLTQCRCRVIVNPLFASLFYFYMVYTEREVAIRLFGTIGPRSRSNSEPGGLPRLQPAPPPRPQSR